MRIEMEANNRIMEANNLIILMKIYYSPKTEQQGRLLFSLYFVSNCTLLATHSLSTTQ